jgi:serine/threonine protein kinase
LPCAALLLPALRYLGGGAFGEVYLCRWHGVEVAVKSLSPSLISNDSTGMPCADACADLLKEAAVLASLHHPNIVSVFGVVLPDWQLLNSRSRTSSSDMANSLQQQQQQGAAAGSTAEQLAAAADELTDELLAAAAGTSRPSSAPGAAGSGPESFSGCRAAMASALSQGHPPAPAIVTEFLSLGSLHNAISGRAEWLRGSMARAKLLLDTARVSTSVMHRNVLHCVNLLLKLVQLVKAVLANVDTHSCSACKLQMVPNPCLATAPLLLSTARNQRTAVECMQ